MSTLYIKNIGLIISLVLLLTSCSSLKTKYGEFNQKFKEYVTKDFKKTQTKDFVKDSIKERIDTNKTLSLENTKRLSSLLEDIGEIDGKAYMLSSDSEDIFIRATKNSHTLNINSFHKLNMHYNLFISKLSLTLNMI